MYDGLLLVDKPAGITSFGVVARVRGMLTRTLRAEHTARGYCGSVAHPNGGQCRCKLKVGHSGTLDPMATGLLILAIGKSTKQITKLIGHDKTYEAELTLGAVSSTGDREGDVTPVSSTRPDLHDVEAVLKRFVGPQLQTPPIYSAIKVDGRRAYDLARRGQTPELKPRSVTIYGIDNVSYRYPVLSFTVRVSSGTYIRSLAADIGQALGTGAYLSALRRTAIGPYDIAQAVSLDNLDEETRNILTNDATRTHLSAG